MTGTTGDQCRELLKRLVSKKPLVHCITNFVSMDLMANALCAIGASPAMVRNLCMQKHLAAIREDVRVPNGENGLYLIICSLQARILRFLLSATEWKLQSSMAYIRRRVLILKLM